MADIEFKNVIKKESPLDGTDLVLGAEGAPGDAQTTPIKVSLMDISQRAKIFNVLDYGARPANSLAEHDSLAGINDCISAATSDSVTAGDNIIYFPAAHFGRSNGSNCFWVSDTVTFPAYCRVVMETPIVATFLGKSIIKWGDPSTPAALVGKSIKLQAYFAHPAGYDWSNPDSVCIELCGINRAHLVEIPYVRGGAVGVRLRSDTAEAHIGYNNFRFGYIEDCQIGIHIYLVGQGWCNHNHFTVNYVRVNSGKPDVDRTAIKVETDGENTLGACNGNYWVGPGFEIADGQDTTITGLNYFLLDAENIGHWEMVNIRSEDNSEWAQVKIWGEYSEENRISFIHSNGVPLATEFGDPGLSQDMPIGTSPVCIIDHGHLSEKGRKLLFDSGNLGQRARPTGGGTEGSAWPFYVPGMAGMAMGSTGDAPAVPAINNYSLGFLGSTADGQTFMSFTKWSPPFIRIRFDNVGLGDRILYITVESPTGSPGRVRVRPLDVDQNLIVYDENGAEPAVAAIWGTWKSTLGGYYDPPSDHQTSSLTLQLRNQTKHGAQVRYVDLVFWEGTAPGGMALSRIKVECSASNRASVVDMNPDFKWDAMRENIGGAIPTDLNGCAAGLFSKGERIINPDAVNPGDDLGWRCTAGGEGDAANWVSLGQVV